jgi:acetate kinase
MILVLNCGSSSIKYRLFDPDLRPLDAGVIERVGEPGGPESHAAALRAYAPALRLDEPELRLIGHRVAHGGDRFVRPTPLDDDVVDAIEELTPLAPLHNPPAVAGIRFTRSARPDVAQVAVFDTAFHATMPRSAATYAIDRATAERYAVRRYGFHGTSYAYVSRATARLIGRPVDEVNSIVLHLGNGASACAIEGGRSVETSMGLTPLEGLVMGTRSGDVDPAVIPHLNRVAGMSLDAIDDLLNRRSGLRGLCGANDMREILARRTAGDPDAGLAFDVYCHRIRKYVGAYAMVLGRVDAITFTGGVGEHAAPVRATVLDGLGAWGIEVDAARNATGSGARLISPDDARIAVCVVPTDEEREIAEQSLAVVAYDRSGAGHA